MKKILLLAVMITIVMLSVTRAGDFEKSADAKAIRAIMDRQVAAWNNGDFEGFMAGYWKSETLTFQSGNTRRHGWQNLLNMYKTNYAGKKRGTLAFTDIAFKKLTGDYVLVLGRWRVTTEKEKKEGLFTLVVQRFGNDWKVIHDHSS